MCATCPQVAFSEEWMEAEATGMANQRLSVFLPGGENHVCRAQGELVHALSRLSCWVGHERRKAHEVAGVCVGLPRWIRLGCANHRQSNISVITGLKAG